jgi:DNA-binding transcriptional LysR family regulator
MSVGNSQDVINAVIDLRVDIGLIEGPCHNVDIIAEPWLEDELVVFAPRPRRYCRGGDAGALAQAPWILREQGSGTREIVDYLLLSHLPRFSWGWSWELGGDQARGAPWPGISCLSRRVIAEQLETGSLVEIPVPLPKLVRTLWRIHHRQKHLSSSLQRFLRYCDVTSPSPQGDRILCFTYNPGRS